jgi:hypothetical protein
MPLKPVAIVLTTSLALLSASSAAALGKQECVDAHAQGQVERGQGQLVRAHESFLKCASTACPTIVASECRTWSAEIVTSIPSIVVVAKDAQGQETADVRVTLDGAPFLDRLDGLAHDVNPGPHVLRAEGPAGAAREERIVVLVGEKERKVEVSFVVAAPAPPAGPVTTYRPVPLLSWVSAGVTVVGLVSFAAFGVAGNAKENGLEGGCGVSHVCSPESLTPVKTDYVIADVSLGVAGVAAVAAVTSFLLRPARAPSGAWLGIVPGRSGGQAWIGGSF